MFAVSASTVGGVILIVVVVLAILTSLRTVNQGTVGVTTI